MKNTNRSFSSVRPFIVLTAALLLFLQAPAFSVTVKTAISNVLNSHELKNANVGVKIVSLSSGKTLYARNAENLFIPASTVKLITGYAALKIFGPSYTFKTLFLTEFSADPSAARNLYIKGFGDPSASFADLNYMAYEVSTKIKHVTGSIIVDNSYFDGVKYGKGWMWDEGCEPWNACIAPYSVNGNCVDIIIYPADKEGRPAKAVITQDSDYAVVVASITTSAANSLKAERSSSGRYEVFTVSGTVSAAGGPKKLSCSVSDPALYAGSMFKTLISRYGTQVKGPAAEGPAPVSAVTVAEFASKPLSQITRYLLKESDNLTGEVLLKNIGAYFYDQPGSAENGVKAIEELLLKKGIKRGLYRIADGSGLSTYNLLSPDVVTKVLAAVYDDFYIFPEFLDSLAASGGEGTLQNRLKLVSPGFVRAKTGTMSGISCISGYVKTKKGNMIAFSIMVNGFTGSSQPYRDMQDEILKIIAERL